MQLKKYCLSLVLFSLCLSLSAQEFFKPSSTYNPGRVNGTIIVESAIGTAVTIGLNYLWYKKFAHGKFHYFNVLMVKLHLDDILERPPVVAIFDARSRAFPWIRPHTKASSQLA